MPLTRAALEALLSELGVRAVTTDHPPIFTVEEGRGLKLDMPGVHSKNLFLKDKRGELTLVCAAAEARVDLTALARLLGAGRFSFAAPELLWEVLGVTPGSVTLFALANDRARQVRLVLDQTLAAGRPANFHPLTNTATTAIWPEGLARFLAHTGHAPTVIAFGPEGAPQRIEPTDQNVHLGREDPAS